MITAKELKKLMPFDANAEISKIQNDLIRQAKHGCSSLTLDYGMWAADYNDPNRKQAREILQGLGFTVEFHTSMSGNTTVIRW